VVDVVDDDPWVRRALGRLLRSAGHATHTFASAEEYLLDPEREPPACLVLDLRLPGASGLDLQRALLAAGCCPPIVFVTGDIDQATRDEVLGNGAADVLLKPVDAATLLEAVSRATAPRS